MRVINKSRSNPRPNIPNNASSMNFPNSIGYSDPFLQNVAIAYTFRRLNHVTIFISILIKIKSLKKIV